MTKNKNIQKHESSKRNAGTLYRESYFPTFIFFRDIPDAEDLNENLKQEIYTWKHRDKDGIVRSNMASLGSWHSPVDMNNRQEFMHFVELVDITMQQVYDNQGYDPAYAPVCDNMWANINPRHGYNRTHIHPNALWSGVYYVQAPENSGRIYLTDPRLQSKMCTPHMDESASKMRDNWEEVYFEPMAGRLLVFPSWLSHEVQPNLSKLKGRAGDRISISFNYVQRLRSTE
jgi:uncharacterized protein (TIGR02466 family)